MSADSGIYLRVERGGRWLSLAIEDMTPEEVDAAFRHRDVPELVRWIAALASKLKASPDLVLVRIAREVLVDVDREIALGGQIPFDDTALRAALEPYQEVSDAG